jgi:hypothetical protein
LLVTGRELGILPTDSEPAGGGGGGSGGGAQGWCEAAD